MKSVIHYVLILDKSGSMQDIKPVVIKSFNEQVGLIRSLQEKQPEAKIRVSLCSFNDAVQFHFLGTKAGNLEKLRSRDYQPDSMTALYDAIGQTWHRVTAEAKPHHKLFFAVFTDGLENASKEFTAEMVSEIIERCGAKGWEFRFFCRYEERLLYKTRFNLPDQSICSMSLNEEGFREMNNQVMCCMERLLDLPEEEHEVKPGK
jgi:hypothetical protein